MSTSDQQGHGPLTRKQLREIRLTGSTPVITPEEAAAAADPAPPSVPPLPRAAEPSPIPPAPRAPENRGGTTRLTRRQVRERERMNAAPVPVPDGEHVDASAQQDEGAVEELVVMEEPGEMVASESVDEAVVEEAVIEQGEVPVARAEPEDGDDHDVEDQGAPSPVSAAAAASTVGDVPLDQDPTAVAHEDDAVTALGFDPQTDAGDAADDVLAEVDDADDEVIAEGERPTVSPAFGSGLLENDAEDPQKPFAPSFDELLTVGDTTGSHHFAPNALIFTPSPGEGSLSGPVASTGEVLITGSYELPQGLGSQGHAHGTADGREVDAVLIDGELPPASSPTPIAASSAVSTIKPAGEVIRPPAPEKGNRLMLTLAITAGGLALALAVVLVVAFTTNVF